MFVELVVYPAVSLIILVVTFRLLRPFIVSRNRILCLALGVFIGAAAGTGFYLFGGGFIMGAAHMDWPVPMFMVFYVVWLIGLPVIPIATAWLTYRKARGGLHR